MSTDDEMRESGDDKQRGVEIVIGWRGIKLATNGEDIPRNATILIITVVAMVLIAVSQANFPSIWNASSRMIGHTF